MMVIALLVWFLIGPISILSLKVLSIVLPRLGERLDDQDVFSLGMVALGVLIPVWWWVVCTSALLSKRKVNIK